MIFRLVLIVILGFVILPTLEDSPLILTPYIEEGRIKEAQQLSLVTALRPKTLSYSGFITVDKNCNGNLWFWFFPSRRDPSKDPVTVWLNGGPGLSSMFGLFLENGPYYITRTGRLKQRRLSWNAFSSVIYVDNPVGTGFSFADRPEGCYSRNQTHIAQNFIVFLEQFFKLFPNFNDNLFYLFGESYAGKYVTGIAYAILTSNTTLRLDGIGIGNGLIDPKSQEVYSDNLYELGIVDDKMKNHIARKENLLDDLIDHEEFDEALNLRAKILRRHLPPTGYLHWYNYLRSGNGKKFSVNYDNYLKRRRTRLALHVGNVTRSDGRLVTKLLVQEMMQSIRPWFEYIIERRRTMLYYGQMDLTVSYAGALNFIRSMKWSGAEDYRTAPRRLWEVKNKLAGYVKSGGLFTEVMVRNAGHNVPADQSAWAYNLYYRFIFNKTDNIGASLKHWNIKTSKPNNIEDD